MNKINMNKKSINKEKRARINELIERSFNLIDDKEKFEEFIDEFRRQLKQIRNEIEGYPINKLSKTILEKIQNKETNLSEFANKTNKIVPEIKLIREKIDEKRQYKTNLRKEYHTLENLFFIFTSAVIEFEETITDMRTIFELVEILKEITPKESQPKEVTPDFDYEKYKEKIESEVAILQNSISEIESVFGKPEWKLIAERAGFIERLEYIDKRIDDTHKFIRMGLIIISVVFGLISSISLIFITLLMSGILPK